MTIQSIFDLQTQHKWVAKTSTASQRIKTLEKLKDVMNERMDDAIQALYDDLRRDHEGAKNEVLSVIGEIDHTVAELENWMQAEEVSAAPFDAAGGKAEITYEARGIVLLFAPWNYPFALLFQPLVSILAAGNTCLVKPNEMSPAVSKLSAEIIRDTFEEKEVAVFEGGVDLANELLELPVDHIFFTGSPAIGKIVMGAAAKNLTSVTLELGGKNPAIIDANADIQDAAGKLAVFRNMNNGQVCLCPENVYVPADKEEEFLATVQGTYQAMFYKDGELNPETNGKIIDQRNFDRVKGYIDDALEKGATIVCGGEGDEELRTIHPTIMKNVPDHARVMQEETFGPLLNVITYTDIDEAISHIQSQPKPLALYIFSKDEEFVDRILDNTSSGGVTVNNCLMHVAVPALPFGGVNNSGMGAYHGLHGFRELSHRRSVLTL